MALFDIVETRLLKDYDYHVRCVMRLIERTIDKPGERLLIPDIALEGWWTSLLDRRP